MTLQEKFRNKALATVTKFSTGDFILRKITEDYNTVTGEVSRINSDTTVPAAMYDITSERRKSEGYKVGDVVVTIAGLSIDPVEPELGDLIVLPSGSIRRIVDITSDQYKACYFMVVTEEQ